MDDVIARYLTRTNLIANSFWEAVGPLHGGWQVSVEDWRPHRGLCERCGRGAGLLAVVVHPDAMRIERLGEECLGYAGLPNELSGAVQRGLRAARAVGKKLDDAPRTEDAALAAWHPGIAMALAAGLGVPDRWRTLAKAARARDAILHVLEAERLPRAYAPSATDLVSWWQVVQDCPRELEARQRLEDIMPRVMDGTASTRQLLVITKVLATPWAQRSDRWPASWSSWGAWPEQVRDLGRRGPRR